MRLLTNGQAPTRIAYLTLEAPREGQASYAHVFEIVEGLKRLNFAVDLYLPSYTHASRRPNLFRRVIEHGLLQAKLLARWNRYDLIYVRGHNMAFPVALIAAMTRRPIIHEVNGPHLDITVTYPWTRYFNGLLRWLQRIQYQLADGLVPVTDQLASWLRTEGCRGEIDVIPNGANMRLFNPQRPRSADVPDRYVIFFGGFARWQGIPVMIEAVEHPAWPRDVALLIAGSGQMESEVHDAASRGSLRYLGKLAYAEIGTVVAGALAGLVPKTRDDDTEKTGLFPIKLFEILACGTPAIVTDYPGQADLVRSGRCGLVIAPNDAGALASAVAALASNESERAAMGGRGHELIANEHSWDRRAAQTAALIGRILNQ